ncbi:MAG: hypothetical protein JW869_07030 [Candidatus Omnitrophica bacterium]|nr:hypothetical protein [Candidatus Omnitrophota bacterium]
MHKIAVNVLILVSCAYLLKVVCSALKTKKAEVKEGIIYRRSSQPVAYWIAVFIQSALALGLMLLLFRLNR